MIRGRASVDFRLYLITDRGQTAGRDLRVVVEAALSGGIRAVQLREKNAPTLEYFELARMLRDLTARYGARLFVNDRIDIALAVGADGVHLPESGLPVAVARELLGPDRLIGASCHSLERAKAAQKQGADFITFGPVYHTPSKAGYGAPVGLMALAEATRALTLPVFALGGVSRDRVPEVQAAGAAGVALISAVLASPEPGAESGAFTTLLDRTIRPS